MCADGGDPDPDEYPGQTHEQAKELELAGSDYRKHLVGRTYGLVVHGDITGIESTRRALTDWLDWAEFVEAGGKSCLDRLIGYYEPYATNHAALDARITICRKKSLLSLSPWPMLLRPSRAGKLREPDANLEAPTPK